MVLLLLCRQKDRGGQRVFWSQADGPLVPFTRIGKMIDDLVTTRSPYYKKFIDIPLTGKVTGKKQGTLTNGKWDGPWVSYYDNGQLRSQETYNNRKKGE